MATWRGDDTNDALALLLNHVGIQCENSGLFLEVAFGGEDTLRALRVIGQMNISVAQSSSQSMKDVIGRLVAGKRYA